MTEKTNMTDLAAELFKFHSMMRKDLNNLVGEYATSEWLADLGAYYAESTPSQFVSLCLIDLPKIGKAFDKMLSEADSEENPFVGLPCTSEGVIPVLDHFLEGPESLPDPLHAEDPHREAIPQYASEAELTNAYAAPYVDLHADTVLAVRQVCYFLKKYQIACSDDDVKAAVDSFLETENCLPKVVGLDGGCENPIGVTPNMFLYAFGQPDHDPEDTTFLRAMDYLSGVISAGIGQLDLTGLDPRHGPGAVSDLPSSGDKYTFPNYPQCVDEKFPAQYFLELEMEDYGHNFTCARRILRTANLLRFLRHSISRV